MGNLGISAMEIIRKCNEWEILELSKIINQNNFIRSSCLLIFILLLIGVIKSALSFVCVVSTAPYLFLCTSILYISLCE